MALKVTSEDLEKLAPAGYYIALRIGLAFPMEEINAFPSKWIDHYTKNRLMLHDPVMHWAYTNAGVLRWSELKDRDTRGVLNMSAAFGLKYGVSISVFDERLSVERSIASFTRSDREYTDLEINLLQVYVKRRHLELAPPSNLTLAELEALTMVKDGLHLKTIAHELGVTEGAIKQRLKKSKLKLGAATSTQAASLARQFKLI